MHTSSQTRMSQSGKKSSSNLNNSSNGFQNYSSVMEMSPSKRGVQQTTQSVLYHTNISGTNVKYTENAADKTQISKLGLKLQPICTKDGHERSKISYICTDLLCMNQQKFGCAHCFLDDHGEHAIRKMRIDEFVGSVEFKHKQYIDSVCNLANLATIMAQPVFLKDILISMDKMKEEFIQRVDIIKGRVENLIRTEINADNSIIENEVDKQQLYLQQLRRTMQKNIFEMNDEEFGYALNIHHDTFASDLMKRTKVIQDRYNELEGKYTTSFHHLQSQLNDELDKIMTAYTDFDLNDDNNNNNHIQGNHNINSSLFMSNNNSPVNYRQRASSQIENSTLQTKNTDNEERQKVQKKQDVQQQKIEEEQQQLTQLLAKKESHENILKNNVKLIDELQTIQRDINYLSTKNHFPYSVFEDCCNHSIKCNTIPIFECCKQAYQCTICHDTQANHKHMMTNPSKRYCIKCFKVFNVKYYTNIAINCKDCLTVKIKK